MGLGRLAALRYAVTAAGATVTVSVEGEELPLSAEADHSAYRILQESLTNVLRHAGPGTAAQVCLRYQPEALTILVTDDGHAVRRRAAEQRRVTTGRLVMASAACGNAPPSLGGELTAGPLPDGGFQVKVTLPIAAGSAGDGSARPECRGARGPGGILVIRVLLADDQVLVRAGFRMLLESAGDIAVVGEAANGGTAVALAREHAPDVVLMDLPMPEVDGVTATRLIAGDPRLAATRVVVLTTFDDDQTVFSALRASASGFLVKDVEPEELLQAVRVVARGDALLSPSVTKAVISAFASGGQHPDLRAERAAAPPASGRPESSRGSGRSSGGRAVPPGLASLTDRERRARSWGWSRRGCPMTRSRASS